MPRVETCNRCGCLFSHDFGGFNNNDLGHCKGCSEYRERAREEATERAKRDWGKRWYECYYCRGSGYLRNERGKIECPHCEGRKGYYNTDPPWDYIRERLPDDFNST